MESPASRKIKILLLFFSCLLAILSHPVLVFGFRFPNLGWLAFVAYIPLLYFIQKTSLKQTFKITFFFSFFFYLGSLYWLYTALHNFGGLSPVLSLITQILLACILATYFSLPFLIYQWVCHCEPKGRGNPVYANNGSRIQCGMTSASYWLLPLFFVAVEGCRNRWPLGGFPWGQLGYSQATYSHIVQIADLLGVYGLTALVLWGNLWALEVFQVIKGKLKKNYLKLSFFPLLFSATILYSHFQIEKYKNLEAQSPSIPVAFIQGNISQDEKWDVRSIHKNLQILRNESQKAFEEGAELVFWPESSYPFEINLRDLRLPEKMGLSGKVVTGALSFEADHFYNSAYLIQDKQLLSVYHKQKLVPYGEYVPLKEYLPFLDKLTEQAGNFYPGAKYTLLEDPKSSAKIGILICYEDIFPEVARGHAQAGANFLANLTNDAWYGLSSALPQHLNFSILRAVENRRMLVRATNTGASALIHSWGALEQALPYEVVAMGQGEVKLLTERSFYTRFGDVFVYFASAVAAFAILLALSRKIFSK